MIGIKNATVFQLFRYTLTRLLFISDIKLGANYSEKIDIKFDQVSKVELDEPDLLSEIGNRSVE